MERRRTVPRYRYARRVRCAARTIIGRLVRSALLAATLLVESCTPHDAPLAPPQRTRTAFAVVPAPALGKPLAIVPRPRRIERAAGSVTLPQTVTIEGTSRAALAVLPFLISELRRLGYRTTAASPGTPATIRLVQLSTARDLGGEGYVLNVDASHIAISARTAAGLFYGVATFGQLATSDGLHRSALPYVRITDWPQYSWRGVHLDVSRHFFSVGVVERYIDLAARYKLNVFHWHLTDDQGWRIAIRAYPRLTSVGGCRDGTQLGGFGSTRSDGIRSCAYYTQRQIRDVVAYAKARYVTVVPEIEGPGHSVEALAAYPWLACTPGAFATMRLWGSTTHNVCPTDRAFAFYDTVFRELAQLFPARLIHVGGDEAGDGRFTRGIEAIAHKYGRRVVGWDEIADAGSQEAIVMAWHPAAGVAALGAGHDVVMAADPPLYFNAYQGDSRYEPIAFPGWLTPLASVYAYDPSANAAPRAGRARLLGAHATVWTEYIPDAQTLWYMAYPRTLALAELCWTPRSRMRLADFEARIGPSLRRLATERIAFRIPEVRFDMETLAKRKTFASSSNVAVSLRSLVPNATIRYTLDGTQPTLQSRPYRRPLRLAVGAGARRVIAIAIVGGRRSAPATLDAAPP